MKLGKTSETSRSRSRGEQELWAVPELPGVEEGRRQTLFHRWDPRIKIASLLLFSFCAASVGTVGTALLCCAVSASALMVAGTPWRLAARRIAAMAAFLAMFFVVLPLTVPVLPGDQVATLGHGTWIQINFRGFSVAALVAAKAMSVALLMEPLLRTSPFPRTVNALARLGVPDPLCQMLLIMYRYVFVFRHEMSRLWVGMNVRGFRPGTNRRTIHILGNFLGMLFVRSLERTERVHEAMLCRGFTGRFPTRESFRSTPLDWALGAGWVLGGVAVLLLDRYETLPFSGVFR